MLAANGQAPEGVVRELAALWRDHQVVAANPAHAELTHRAIGRVCCVRALIHVWTNQRSAMLPNGGGKGV